MGGGQLAGQAAVAVELPAEVKLTGYLVENGDTVRAGDAIAAVDRVSVMTAIAAVQQTLDDLTEQIADAASSASSQSITAVSGGVVKTLYAQAGDKVQDVMLEHGALAVLSLDGLLAVQLSASAQPGQTVTVTLPGGGISGGFSGGFSGGGTQQEESAALYSLERVTAASVTAQERMTLEITVDELDITRVRVGQSAAVTLDALLGERFEATVSQVAASGTNEGGSSKFTVELTLPRSGDMLSGMRACAFLTLDTTEHTLTVPAAALDEADGQTVLYTALDPDTGAPAAPLPVETGLADADYVQLLTPLPEETTVYYLYYE